MPTALPLHSWAPWDFIPEYLDRPYDKQQYAKSRSDMCICGTSITCGINSTLNTQNANKTKLDEKEGASPPPPNTRNLPLPDVALGTKSSSISSTFFCWVLTTTKQFKHLATHLQHVNFKAHSKFPNFAKQSRPNHVITQNVSNIH